MAGNFAERIDKLQEDVGTGRLTMRLNVHQPYAAAEHQRMYYRHPHGGESRYVEVPFETQQSEMLQRLAGGVLDNLKGTAIEVAMMFEEMVQTNAPVESSTLRMSCNIYVEDNGASIFEKPQEAPFNTKKE